MSGRINLDSIFGVLIQAKVKLLVNSNFYGRSIEVILVVFRKEFHLDFCQMTAQIDLSIQTTTLGQTTT